MPVRTKSLVVRTAFLATIFCGILLNVCQILKLRHEPDESNRRNQVESNAKLKTYMPEGVAKRSIRRLNDMVKANDFVYSKAWDASPIVIESHKLVFFTVPKAG
jgi:hypothetical protein